MQAGITTALSHTPKTLRQRLRGWSQRELARRAQVSVNTIVSIEGGCDVNTQSLGKVAAALGVNRWELMRAMDEVHRPVALVAYA